MAGRRVTRLSSSKIASSQSKKSTTTRRSQRHDTCGSDDSFGDDHDASDAEARPTKKRKLSNARTGKQSNLPSCLFEIGLITHPDPCVPSTGRHHSLFYHKPLMLCRESGQQHRQSLLSWFDSVSTARAMPWRKAWINPKPAARLDDTDQAQLRQQLARRAYEVWISEIMLQQTRVAVVIDYWKRWMERWPTIHDLAAADAEEVLAAWRGLGYYSRATRIHEAAKIVVHDKTMRGLLPSATADLEAKVPGVGRYTAGAISAIVFGRPAPMVDGNVLRVLSRQLGIHGNIKTEKRVIDAIWAAADALVKAVSSQDGDRDEDPDSSVSNRPGRWGQALMELGSTICTPKPNCVACPISASCRVYGEAKTMANPSSGTQHIADMEDACTLCEPFEEDVHDHDPAPQAQAQALHERKTNAGCATQSDKTRAGKKPKQMTLAAFAFTGPLSNKDNDARKEAEAQDRKEKERELEQTQKQAKALEAISSYARKFPIKTTKKPVRVEQEIVCAIQRRDGKFLIRRRPEKGLLAGLWEFPSTSIANSAKCSPTQRSELARAHATSMLAGLEDGGVDIKYVGELGSVPWLFSHIKLTMHVHMFRLLSENEGAMDAEGIEIGDLAGRPVRWTANVEGESMGTGMRKCWDLVKAADDD
ncbi:hypothetical protein E4U21_004912 [Claviceps maximensis]|nr:hypothetical protein E4U21_004912 [Claviceps maximensis]